MNAARDVRLLRVAHLRAAQRVLASLAAASPRAVILVPTRPAALELRRTLASAGVEPGRQPPVLTRSEWLLDLFTRCGDSTPVLGGIEREILLAGLADRTVAAGTTPPFVVRPGLIGEMLRLYDNVRRYRRSVDDVERVLVGALAPGSDIDRGAARLLEQTRFLVEVFRGYEAALVETGAIDEHGLRERVAATPAGTSLEYLIIATGDEVAIEGGLWPADYDLITRLPGLARIDVVATARDLDAGFRERLFDLLPGIEEARVDEPDDGSPVLLVPAEPAAVFHLSRDREEELVALARRGAATDRRADDVVVVYQRPLPYVYLARRVFAEAGMPFTTADTLPLAAEPYVAAVDLVFDAVLAAGQREPVLRLLDSPVLTWRPHGRTLASGDRQVLREWWSAHPGADPGEPLSEWHRRGRPVRQARLRRARAAAAAALADLRAFERERPRSEHVRALAALLMARAPVGDLGERAVRARGAVLGLLEELARACERHADDPATLRTLVPVIRRAIEQHTFAPVEGSGGVRLLDARSARYARADEAWLVGVNEGEWPLPSRGSVFYPAGLLRDLGFPAEQARQAHARAGFHDLLDLARHATGLSVVQLEEDALVRPSVLLEDLDIDDSRTVSPPPASPPPSQEANDEAWTRWRATRPSSGDPRRRGSTPPPPARVLSVTQIERYLDCPFKFFASVVLGLEEEEDRQEVGLDPRRRGTLVHQVFQDFFGRWSADAGGAISPGNLPAARTLFEEVASGCLDTLPEADRIVEGLRLLGSAAGPGLGDRVFRLEALSPQPVVERLLEFDLRGTYLFGPEPATRLTVKGIADRIDLLADGTLRLIDYKTGKAPDTHRSIQLAVYALCAEQRLDGYRGRRWRVGQAAYLALGDSRPWVPVVRQADDRAGLEAAEGRLLQAIAGIAAGVFGAAPADRRLCRTCAFAAVCRKDYVDDAA